MEVVPCSKQAQSKNAFNHPSLSQSPVTAFLSDRGLSPTHSGEKRGPEVPRGHQQVTEYRRQAKPEWGERLPFCQSRGSRANSVWGLGWEGLLRLPRLLGTVLLRSGGVQWRQSYCTLPCARGIVHSTQDSQASEYARQVGLPCSGQRTWPRMLGLQPGRTARLGSCKLGDPRARRGRFPVT